MKYVIVLFFCIMNFLYALSAFAKENRTVQCPAPYYSSKYNGMFWQIDFRNNNSGLFSWSKGIFKTANVNVNLKSGTYKVIINRDGLTSGIYFYQLKTDNYTETKKLILLK